MLLNATDVTSTQATHYELLWVGVLCAVCGNVSVSVGLLLQKYAHKTNAQKVAYTSLGVWWVGIFFMVLGECGNFLAYGMAPATLVSPLGGITVVSIAILSRLVLKEPMTWDGLFGVALVLCGSALITINTPSSKAGIKDPGFIYHSLISWRSLAFFSIVCTSALYIANPLRVQWAISEAYAQTNVLCYCLFCGLVGSITVTSSKGISTALTLALNGKPAMFTQSDICWLTYCLFASLIVAVVLQVRFLNKAMMNFCSGVVVPIYYIVFTSISISAGMVLFLEISFSPLISSILLFVTGLLLAFFGVYLVSNQSMDTAIIAQPSHGYATHAKQNHGYELLNLNNIQENEGLVNT